MDNYLEKFRQADIFVIENLIPHGICPFLFYNLVPYIFTLINGGWFGWVFRGKDISYRKPIVPDDFKKKRINSLYPNEVLVRCPNPYADIVAGVGVWPEQKIKIRILRIQNLCVNKHSLGQEIILENKDTNKKILQFSQDFPRILVKSVGGSLLKENKNFCGIEKNIKIGINNIIFQCRYHKKIKQFKGDFLPGGFCLHAFSAVFPHVLALMYNAKVDKLVEVNCPGNQRRLIFNLEKICIIKNKFIGEILNLLRKIYEAGFYPIDLLDYNLKMNVVESSDLACFLEKRKSYFVNLTSADFLCPASLYALYPYMMVEALGYKIFWNKQSGLSILPCPDCVGTIYRIS